MSGNRLLARSLDISKEEALQALQEYKAWLLTKPKVSKPYYSPFKAHLWKSWPGSKNPKFERMFDCTQLKNIVRGKLNYTRGEWSLPHLCNTEPDGCRCGYVLSERDMGAICEVYWSPDEKLENGDNPPIWEAIDNAKLISNAALMYEELKRLDPENPLILKIEGR